MLSDFFFVTLTIIFILHSTLLTLSIINLGRKKSDPFLIASIILSSVTALSVVVINALVFTRLRTKRSGQLYGIALAYVVVLLMDVLLCCLFVFYDILSTENIVMIVVTLLTFGFTFFHFFSFITDLILQHFFHSSITRLYCRWIEKCCGKLINLVFILVIVTILGYLGYKYFIQAVIWWG